MTRFENIPTLPASAPAPRALIVGAGIGGLSAAMQLGAKGYRVTIVDKLNAPGGRGTAVWQDGHRFDLGPTSITRRDLYEDLWARCGRDFGQEVQLRALDPLLDIRWSDGARFSLCPRGDKLRDQVAAFAPGDLNGFDLFMRECAGHPPTSLYQRLSAPWVDNSLYAYVRRRFRDERLREAFSCHALRAGCDPLDLPASSVPDGYPFRRAGAYAVMGGVTALARAMADVVKGQGGTLVMNTIARTVTSRDGQARGVRLSNGQEVTADLVLTSAEIETPHMQRHSGMSFFTWYFGTRKTRRKWRDIGHSTVLCGSRYVGAMRDIFARGQIARDVSLFVHRVTDLDPSAAPEGGDTFTVLCPVPHLGHAGIDWIAEEGRLKGVLLKRLEETLMPDLGTHIVTEQVFTPHTFESRYLSPVGLGVLPDIGQGLRRGWFGRPLRSSVGEEDTLRLPPGIAASVAAAMRVQGGATG